VYSGFGGWLGGEQEALEHWQTKRDKTRRGIVEVISDDSE